MKLISLIGNDPLKVLLPLTQLTNLIDGAYFLVTETDLPRAQRLCNYLIQTETEEGSPSWEQSIEIVVFPKGMQYPEIYGRIREIMDQEFCRNEEIAFDFDGGSKLMKRAARFAAGEMLAPILHVNTRSNRMKLTYLAWDRKTYVKFILPCVPMDIALLSLLRLNGLEFRQDEKKCSSRGFQYERNIYTAFVSGNNAGKFSGVERNLVFTWDTSAEKTNEIDIVVLRNGVIGFISIKSGKGFRKASVFKNEYKKIIQRYPDTLAGKPCLKMLISKSKINSGRFIRMLANEIVAIDDVSSDGQLQMAVDLAAAGCDYIAKTGRHLPLDFYHRFINKQFGRWGNEIGKRKLCK